MKILTKYLFKGLTTPLLYCLTGFMLLFVINDLFDNFSDFVEGQIPFLSILYYYSMTLPAVVVLIMPACLLLAVLYSLSQLTRHSEITAMRAGGISIYRVVKPFFVVGLLATLVSGFFNEVIAPDATYRAEQFLKDHKYHQDGANYFANNIALKNARHVWMIEKFDTRDHSMYNAELVIQRPDGSDETKYKAEKALWMDGRWWFIDLTVQEYLENGDLAGPPEIILQKEMRELTETPLMFMSEIKDAQYLSSKELVKYLETKTGISENTRARLRVDLHAHLSTPLVCLIVTMIGIPVGAHTGRRGAFAGIMMAMMLFFVFYILQLGSQYLGKQELIAPWIGGWFPVILFGAVSPLFIHRMR